jgi:hypothetical protein
MDSALLHALLSAAAIGLGLYLFGHPHVMSSKTQLIRGVVIWMVLVLALRALDYLFLP